MTQIETINEKVNETAEKLAELEAERSSYQSLMTEAVNNGDAEKILELKRRHTELPDIIAVTRIGLAKLQIEYDQARLPELNSEAQKSAEPIQAAIERRDAAEKELQDLRSEHYAATENAREVNRRIAARKIELERLVGEADPKRPSPQGLRNLNTQVQAGGYNR